MPEEKVEIRLDADVFHKRARHFLSNLKSSPNKEASDELIQAFQGVNSILVVVGELREEYPYQKSTAIQQWLLGYEFNDTLILFTPDKIHFIVKEKKAEVFEQLKQGDRQVPFEIHKRSKDSSHNQTLFEQIISKISEGEQKRVGLLLKDKMSGNFVQEWQNVYNKFNQNFEEKTTRMACKISTAMMYRFINVVSSVIDEEKEITHEQLSEDMENMLYTKDEKWLTSQKSLQDVRIVDFSRTDVCYAPIIQSGGVYDFKPSAQSNTDKLHDGTILCSLGVRYKSYCSNIGRTILIDPTKEQEKNYEFLLDIQRRTLELLKDGQKIGDIYSRVMNFVKNKRSDLADKFVKSLGHGMGIEFRESAYNVNQKNTKVLKAGMVLNLFIGFLDLENPKASDEKSKTYSLWVIDTVKVGNNSSQLLTEGNRTLDSICFSLKDDNESDHEAKETKPRSKALENKRNTTRKSAVLRTKFRSEEKDDESQDQRRKKHQEQLAARKQADGLARFSEKSNEKTSQHKAVFRAFESYKRDTALPKEVKDLKIIVDSKSESIILPVFGFAVPFHISTLKNVNKSEEGEYVYLRLNFMTPGQATGKKEDNPFDDPNANFIRAFTYRSTDPLLSEIYKKIIDLKKAAAKRETERKEMADLIAQDKLIEIKGRRPTQRLSDVFVRPGLEGKRVPGELEIHENGLRYHSHRTTQKLGNDILFSNIKHLFFQPCDNELIVLLHIHLNNPIIHGKKKTKDIQFYREASDVQFDETGNRKRKYRYGDEDELGAEQEERRRRAVLNREFKTFAEKIAEASEGRVDVDIPFREIGFQGVPFRTNVLLQPTTECLVHLTDPPFLVVPLPEIEIAHLERVQFGLKNFDLVFIFKDYSRPPVHINTIPMNQLENVKDWLDSVDINFYEGTQNLNWAQIMKTINSDPADFFEQGGWSFLKLHSENEDSAASSDSASEYMQSEDSYEESSSDDSSLDEDASDVSTGSGSEESSDESAPDWDEHEEKARRADERKHGTKKGDDSDDDRVKSKKYRR
ncbi:FACT complex subunit-domain-containing protein [Gigaspora rosea]|uniref:FACT complex subunit n=1 Tax=Gigaspora rosea TaxID=44941 RepID=A0A397UCB5_9GLOM|nr:FACT complex subunit-domain-containing protein [Gigaspora rosea]